MLLCTFACLLKQRTLFVHLSDFSNYTFTDREIPYKVILNNGLLFIVKFGLKWFHSFGSCIFDRVEKCGS